MGGRMGAVRGAGLPERCCTAPRRPGPPNPDQRHRTRPAVRSVAIPVATRRSAARLGIVAESPALPTGENSPLYTQHFTPITP